MKNVSSPKHFIIGLTGNIGTGKSIVRKMLQHLGAYGIDADSIAHKALTADGPATNEITRLFGNVILDDAGKINRAKIANVVFKNKKSLLDLESILHPLITIAIKKLIDRSRLPIIVIEAIKLLETDLVDLCDCIWVVDTNEEIIFERLASSRGMERGKIIERLSNQSPINQKRQAAYVVIENNQNLFSTWQSVKFEWKKLSEKNNIFSKLEENLTDLMSPFNESIVLPQTTAFYEIEKSNESSDGFTWLSKKAHNGLELKKIYQQGLTHLSLTYFIFAFKNSKEIKAVTIWDISQFELTLIGYQFTTGLITDNNLNILLKNLEDFGRIHQIQQINIPLDTFLKERMTSFRELGYNSVDEGEQVGLYWIKAGYNLYRKNISENFNLFSR